MNNRRLVGSILFTIIGYILLALLFVNLFRLLNGSADASVSFAGFLEYVSNCPTIHFQSSLNSFTITGSWGVFDFLRSFFNVFGAILGVLVYLFNSLLNMLMYVGYFLGYLFVQGFKGMFLTS